MIRMEKNSRGRTFQSGLYYIQAIISICSGKKTCSTLTKDMSTSQERHVLLSGKTRPKFKTDMFHSQKRNALFLRDRRSVLRKDIFYSQERRVLYSRKTHSSLRQTRSILKKDMCGKHKEAEILAKGTDTR